MLATVLTGMLIRFGGHALSMLAGNLAGTIQSQGTSAAMKTGDPAGSAGMISQMREADPTHAWANQFSYWQTLRSGALDKMSHTESNLQTTDALGGVVKDAAHARGTKLSKAQNDAGLVCGYCENSARRHDKDTVVRLQQLPSFLFSEIHRNDIFFVIIYLAE